MKVIGVGRNATLTIKAADGKGEPVDREAGQIEAASPRALSGVDDMVQLDELTEATVLSTLRVRYDRKDIYTNVGGILIAARSPRGGRVLTPRAPPRLVCARGGERSTSPRRRRGSAAGASARSFVARRVAQVNPYESLEEHIYGQDQMQAYQAADAAFAGVTPHPYSRPSVHLARRSWRCIGLQEDDQCCKRHRRRPSSLEVWSRRYLLAEAALRALDRDRSSQSFVISGESGSGKTETCKYILRYLSYRSKKRQDPRSTTRAGGASRALEEAVLLSNPILESFGNAKTLRNDNSSRWGKYTQVFVQPSSGAIRRVGIEAYLLEKVRVVERAEGERNFHVLYQLAAGRAADSRGKDAGLALASGLGDAAVQHAVLRDKGYDRRDTSNPSVAACSGDDGVNFGATRKALKALGIDEVGAFGALAAVCHLCDVSFDEVAEAGQDHVAAVAKQDLRQRGVLGSFAGRHAVDFAAEALGVGKKELEEALVARRLGPPRAARKIALGSSREVRTPAKKEDALRSSLRHGPRAAVRGRGGARQRRVRQGALRARLRLDLGPSQRGAQGDDEQRQFSGRAGDLVLEDDVPESGRARKRLAKTRRRRYVGARGADGPQGAARGRADDWLAGYLWLRVLRAQLAGAAPD